MGGVRERGGRRPACHDRRRGEDLHVVIARLGQQQELASLGPSAAADRRRGGHGLLADLERLSHRVADGHGQVKRAREGQRRAIEQLGVEPHADDVLHAGLDEGLPGELREARRHEHKLQHRLAARAQRPQLLGHHRLQAGATVLEGQALRVAVARVVQAPRAERHAASQALGRGEVVQQADVAGRLRGRAGG